MSVDASDSISQLKDVLKVKVGLSVERQLLLFGGERLVDEERSLDSYGVGKNAQLLLQDFGEIVPASWPGHHARSLSYGELRTRSASSSGWAEASRHINMGSGSPGPRRRRFVAREAPVRGGHLQQIITIYTNV